MPTSARPAPAAAAALLLAAAATPALAQGSQGYGTQGYGSQGGHGQPSSGYDRQGYPPPSTYDRGAGPQGSGDRNGLYGGGGDRYGQPDRYGDASGGGDAAADPQELARRLNLTASQRGAFDSYRRAFQPDEARARQEEDEMRRMASLPTPQRLDMARASMTRDRADFDRTEAATRAFYAQLSPAQRRTFDQLTAPQMDEDGGDEGGGPSPTQPAARPPR